MFSNAGFDVLFYVCLNKQIHVCITCPWWVNPLAPGRVWLQLQMSSIFSMVFYIGGKIRTVLTFWLVFISMIIIVLYLVILNTSTKGSALLCAIKCLLMLASPPEYHQQVVGCVHGPVQKGYELINLRVLNFHIWIRCTSFNLTLCEISKATLKFHTRFLTYRLEDSSLI